MRLTEVRLKGSINDFCFQFDVELGLNRDEFTLVALDLPGYGKSDSEERDFCYTSFERDASIAAKLMALLKFKTYAVCGWDDGARVAAILAIRNQSRVNALVLWGFTPMMDEATSKIIGKTRDIGTWDECALKIYSAVYGEHRFSQFWRKYVDYIVSNMESPEQFDIKDQLHMIKCPTLVLHGTNDPIVSFARHVEPVKASIYDADVVLFKSAAHNIHQARASEFNRIVTTFVASSLRV